MIAIAKERPSSVPIADIVGRLHHGKAASVMQAWPSDSVDLVITSPPYWTAVEYDGQTETWPTYESYLDEMNAVWLECARVLRPNGKLCINAPIMPVPKAVIGEQHTRHLKNIAADLEQRILLDGELLRYGFFIWQKQTSKLMFGSYPYPGNILENNTIEFINVYVKPGKPPRFDTDTKEANVLSQAEWVDLTQQIWFMYPEDVKREEGHPAPFPEKLPARLMRLYSYGAAADFAGEIVLDPFVGTGTTCVVAEKMGRQWIGIDTSRAYLDYAEQRIARAEGEPQILVGRARYLGKEELAELAASQSDGDAKKGEAKHKRATYGRKVKVPAKGEQLRLV